MVNFHGLNFINNLNLDAAKGTLVFTFDKTRVTVSEGANWIVEYYDDLLNHWFMGDYGYLVASPYMNWINVASLSGGAYLSAGRPNLLAACHSICVTYWLNEYDKLANGKH